MYKLTLFILITFLSTSCFQNETQESLLSPVYQKCRLSKQTINGNRSIDVIYEGDIIKTVEFYDANGALIVKREYTYENGKIASIADPVNKWTYSYNVYGDLEKEEYCGENNNCCNTSHSYTYDGGACPIKQTVVECTSGYYRKDEYRYLNAYSCSAFIYAYDRGGNSKTNEDKSVIKYDTAINPYILIFPGEDYYLSELETQDIKVVINSVKEFNTSGYPTKMEVDINGSTVTYEFEYICDQ
jgi:hypothetical protein